MGFLARRTPAPPAPTGPAAGPPAAVPPARIKWQHHDAIGWERLPAPARGALARTGWAVTAPIAACTYYAPTTRRDPAGRYWRDTDAWWIDRDTLLVVRAREALTQIGTGSDGRPRLRRRRRGGGTVQLTTHQLTGPAPTGQRWSRPPQGSAAGVGGPEHRLTDAAVEVLPRAIQDEIGHPTGQGAIRHYPPHGGYHEQVFAYRRISPTELVVVSATREAGAYPDPDTAIAAADWHVTTYRPHVGAPSESALAM